MTKIVISRARRTAYAGQSLIEVVIALVVVGLIAAGLIKITSTSVRNARYASEQTGAVALAEKKLAELKVDAMNNGDVFWSSLPRLDSETLVPYCWFADIDFGAFPTDTTPRYGESRLAVVKAYVFWEPNGSNLLCLSLAGGKSNYRRMLEFTTMIAK